MKHISNCLVCGKRIVSYSDRKTCSKECENKWKSRVLIAKWQKNPWIKCKLKDDVVKRRYVRKGKSGIDKLLEKIFEGV